MAKTIKISKSLADKLRQFKEEPRSSLFFIGKDNRDVFRKIFKLPKDGGCGFTQAVKHASMAKSLLTVYKARLIPAGFFFVPTYDAFGEGGVEEGDLAAKRVSKTHYMSHVIAPIFTSDMEFMFHKFPKAPAIVVCEHNLYAAYFENSSNPHYLKIKEV